MTKDAWNPERYREFKAERSQPFFDLLAMLKPQPQMRVIDLGCGTGELTQVLHHHVNAVETIGLDNSEAMLSDAHYFEAPGLHFTNKSIAAFDEVEVYDAIFSNAALQWCPNHQELFRKLRRGLRSGGQLAIQMPANHDHVAHRVARELAGEPRFKSAIKEDSAGVSVLEPEEYSVLLNQLGFKEQHVRLQVYAHLLPSKESVIQWTKGTMLTRYESCLSEEMYREFFEEYRKRVLAQLDDSQPYFYPFKRVLLWGRAS